MPLPEGFAYLDEVDPTIVVALRYAGPENLLGRPVAGYSVNRAICTRVCAEKLRKIQQQLRSEQGWCLVVYDAYRPRRAVEDFLAWCTVPDPQPPYAPAMKYYPGFRDEHKRRLFELGYISATSNHCRGSTVDVSVVPWERRSGVKADMVLPVQMRRLTEGGQELPYVDDGTLDMGTSFDLMHPASHADDCVNSSSDIVPREPFQVRRGILRAAFEREGFCASPEEWWHFWLRDEPFPRDESAQAFGFDFPVA
jgi:D-alanyl-D-alanine dipeptidase